MLQYAGGRWGVEGIGVRQRGGELVGVRSLPRRDEETKEHEARFGRGKGRRSLGLMRAVGVFQGVSQWFTPYPASHGLGKGPLEQVAWDVPLWFILFHLGAVFGCQRTRRCDGFWENRTRTYSTEE